MAAKQRLTKGRIKARQKKMHLIARFVVIQFFSGRNFLMDNYQFCNGNLRFNAKPVKNCGLICWHSLIGGEHVYCSV